MFSERVFNVAKKAYFTFIYVLTIFVLLLMVENGHALLVKVSLEDLSIEASSIVVGEVTNVQFQWEGGNIFTYVTVSVEQYVKGAGGTEISVKVPGGTVGDITQWVSDVPSFQIGERMLLFLKDGFFQIVGWRQGKFTIVNHEVMVENILVDEADFINRVRGILGMPPLKIEKIPRSKATVPVITNITGPSITASGTKGSPPFGPGGGISDIVITGSGFGSSPGRVTFPRGYDEPEDSDYYYDWIDTRIECHIPYFAYSGDIRVYNASGQKSNPYPNYIIFGTYWKEGYDHEVKWPKPAMGEGYFVNENCSDVTNERIAIEAAMNTWNNAGADFEFLCVGSTSKDIAEQDEYNIIAWNDLDKYVAVNYTLSFATSSGEARDGDIIFNTDYTWSTTGEAGKYDIQNVATHELGHTLLLTDLYGEADKEKTMYGDADKGETKKRLLHPDDILGILYLYGVKPPTTLWHPDGTLIKASDDGRIYVLQNKQRRYIPNPDIFNANRYDWNRVITVSPEERDGYCQGTDIGDPGPPILKKTADNPTVYRISDGKKHSIYSWDVFLSWGYKDEEIQVVSQAELDQYPTGEPVIFRDGSLIRNVSDPKVYVIEQKIKRPFESEEPFFALGFTFDMVVKIPDEDLENLNGILGNGPTITLKTIQKSPSCSDTIPPDFTLGLSEPELISGQICKIPWSIFDNIPNVIFLDIYCTINEWQNASKINPQIIEQPVHSSSTGSFDWTVPNTPTDKGAIRIVGYDEAGNVGYDYTESFVISSSDPLPAPTLNPIEQISANAFRVSWNVVDGATKYLLQEDDNDSFSSPQPYIESSTQKDFINKPAGTYYYRVKAQNAKLESEWSNTQSYTHDVDSEPSKPVAIYPEDDATIDDNFVTLQWESHGGNGELRYTVYLAHWHPTGNPPIAEDITQTSYTVDNLEYNSSYYWQIQVTDEDGDENLSEPFKFTVAPEDNPPTGNVLINDGEPTTISFAVTLTLSATDTQSEVEYMRLSNNGTNWTLWVWYQTSYPWNLSDYHYGGDSKNGVKTVYVQFKDASDNPSEVYADTIEKTDGTPGNIILNGRHYDTIRDAVAAAQAGDTVYLTAGVYTIQGEANPPRYPATAVGIVLKDGVTLMGEGAEKTTIIGAGFCAWTIIDANNSMVSGLTIMNEDDYEPVLLESNASQLKNCIIKNSTRSAINLYHSENNKICNNLIVNNDTGIHSRARSNVKIYNNTITNNTTWGIIGYLKDGGHEIKNNIICYNNTGVTIETGFTFTHNDVYGNVTNYEGDGWMDDQTGINGNISQDPRFVDAPNDNYHLSPNSPCISTGTDVGIPYNGAPDMGAFEYDGTGTIQVQCTHPDAQFIITGVQYFEGSGEDWSQSNLSIGIYAITFMPIENYNIPHYTANILESGQTLLFEGNYSPDQEPPIVSILINYGEYAAAYHIADIALSAADETAGLGSGSQMQFSNNGSNWSPVEPYSSLRKDWDFGSYGGNLSPGIKTVYAKVSDNLGNWSEAIADEILYAPNRRILAVPDEFQSIQSAVNAAQEGDMVWVAPGTYQEDIVLKEGVILQGSGPEVTTINYDTNDYITIEAANNSKIDGFAMNKGTGQRAYKSISCANAFTIISNNILYGSWGVNITGDCTPIIRNNIFDENNSAIFCGSSTIIENNTIVNTNEGIYVNLPNQKRAYITNNIIANNEYGIYDVNEDREHQIIFSSFNTYWNNTNGNAGGESSGDELFGPGDVDTDPRFTDPANSDFSLRPDSPCINSGNPEARYNDNDGTPNDRGAYGGPRANTYPNAHFTADPQIGGIGQEFSFDASLSSDRESDRLNFRWDWESDGTFDTLFSFERTVKHKYTSAGEKTITLQVRDEGGFVGSTSKTVNVVNQPPNTPSNPNPADNATDQPINIQLSWQGGDPNPTDTVTYDVYFGTTSEPPLVSDDQTETGYTPETLDYHKFYYWKIVATDNHDDSATSPTWSFVTQTESVPETPSNLSALAISSNQIDLTWQDNSTNELGFKIERKKGIDGTYIQIYTVDAGITAYSDISLSPNTTYFYRVRAYNKTGDSEYSNEANATTPINYGDVSDDGNITAYDASLVLQHIVGLIELSPNEQEVADVTGDDTISALDAALILQYTVGLITRFPVEPAPVAPALNPKTETKLLTKVIEQLETISLTKEQKQVLEQLKNLVFSQLIPKHTALLQNFPNPFNPETWIPFELAKPAEVTIRIYNLKGRLIRTINLGQKDAGFYMSKERVARWDGKDSFGEKVASGVYFYTLQTGEFRATRKMVIMK